MFILWATLKVKPEGREGFIRAITANAKLSVRDEEGCYRFDVVELGEGSNQFAFYEVYRDREAFDSHQATPHFLAYKDISARVVVSDNQTDQNDQTDVRGELLASFGKAQQPGLLIWTK